MISGRGPNQFSPLRGTRSSSGETYISHKWRIYLKQVKNYNKNESR